jgi:hypothetical protein
MALGKRRRERQMEAFVAASDLPKSPGHPFYTSLNRLLAEHRFDALVEKLCAPYYAETMGRPGVPPGVFFRMLFVGYFEGLLWGEAIGIDSTTIQANASMRSIVRKDSGKGWKDYTRKLAKKAGLDDPTADELKLFDRNRTGKKVSNDDWENPHDPDATITRMKDGRPATDWRRCCSGSGAGDFAAWQATDDASR